MRHVTRPAGTAAACLLAALAGPARGQDVDVRWDARGVPHVMASTDEGVFYGQGYAAAADRLAQMTWVRMAARGELSRLVGNPTALAGKSPLDQDREMRWIQLYEQMEARVQRLDAQTLSALQAYSDGVNQYISEVAQSLTSCTGDSPLLADPLESMCGAIMAFPNADFPEWTPVDCLAAWEWWLYWFTPRPFGSDAKNLANGSFVPGEVIPDEDATAIVEADMDPDLLDDAETYAQTYHSTHMDICTALAAGEAPTFSHSWVVGGTASDSTGAIVVSGPKTAVLSPSMFHEVHVENVDSVAGFNARGICLTGTPGFFQGFNSQVAWGGSSLGIDIEDLIRVVPDPADPDHRYLYDEDGDGTSESLLFNTSFETIPILGVPQNQWPRIKITTTVFGPVITDETGLITQGQGFDYVLRSNLTYDHDKHTVQSTLGMLHTRSAESWRESAKYWLSPPIQTVFGDASGTIGYTPQLAVPTRGDPHAYAGHVAVEHGDDPDHDWVRTLPYDLLPWSIKEEGSLISANQRPAGCWYPIPMLLMDASQHPNYRWLRVWEHLLGPAAASSFDAEDVATMFFDPTHPGRREVVKIALDLQAQSYPFSSQAQTALAALGPWYANGAKSEADDPAFEYVAGLKLRIPTSATMPTPPPVNEIVATYGAGTGGAIAMFRDLIENATVVTPDGTGGLHDQIAGLVNYWLGLGTTAPPASFPMPYFAFVFGGTLPSANALKDRTIDLNCYDGETLWSPGGTAYLQVVDTAAPNDTRVIRPIGNHEDPDQDTLYPALDEHFDDEVAAIWTDGLESVTTTVLDAMNDGSLLHPTTPDEETSFAFFPTVSYYGNGWAGADPERALSIEIAGSPATISPGDTIGVTMSDLPDGWVRVLYIGVGKDFDDAIAVPNVLLTTAEAYRIANTTVGDKTFSITIPATYEGDYVTFQGWIVEPSTNELRSTGGLQIALTQP